MDKDKLVELAERCEAAAGAHRGLDFAIYEAMNPPKAANAEPIKPKHRYLYGEEYTGSLDAAMKLVPDGWAVRDLGEWTSEPGISAHWSVDLRRLDRKHHVAQGEAATAALALCAAALRSHAPK